MAKKSRREVYAEAAVRLAELQQIFGIKPQVPEPTKKEAKAG